MFQSIQSRLPEYSRCRRNFNFRNFAWFRWTFRMSQNFARFDDDFTNNQSSITSIWLKQHIWLYCWFHAKHAQGGETKCAKCHIFMLSRSSRYLQIKHGKSIQSRKDRFFDKENHAYQGGWNCDNKATLCCSNKHGLKAQTSIST